MPCSNINTPREGNDNVTLGKLFFDNDEPSTIVPVGNHTINQIKLPPIRTNMRDHQNTIDADITETLMITKKSPTNIFSPDKLTNLSPIPEADKASMSLVNLGHPSTLDGCPTTNSQHQQEYNMENEWSRSCKKHTTIIQKPECLPNANSRQTIPRKNNITNPLRPTEEVRNKTEWNRNEMKQHMEKMSHTENEKSSGIHTYFTSVRTHKSDNRKSENRTYLRTLPSKVHSKCKSTSAQITDYFSTYKSETLRAEQDRIHGNPKVSQLSSQDKQTIRSPSTISEGIKKHLDRIRTKIKNPYGTGEK